MIHPDATDLQVATLRAAARRLKEVAPTAGNETSDDDLDEVARTTIECAKDWRDLKSSRSKYADR